MEIANSIRVIEFDEGTWELSKCSCVWWHKYLKCNHIITLAVRLKKASYIAVAFSAPITHKRRKGRPALTVSSLARQPNELQDDVGIEMPQSDEEGDDGGPLVLEDNPVQVVKKRGRPPKKSAIKEPERASKRLKKNE